MKMIFVTAIAGFVVSLAANGTAEPYRFGKYAERLTTPKVEAILAATGTVPWALRGRRPLLRLRLVGLQCQSMVHTLWLRS
jgi:hypothetical protein